MRAWIAVALLALSSSAAEAGLIGSVKDFGSESGKLYSVNETTGAVTLIGAGTNPHALSGIDFHPVTGLLYGVWTASGSGNPSTLVRLDPVTGSLISTIGTVTLSSVPLKISDLAFDPISAGLFGIDRFGELVTIDRATGVATLVGDPGLSGATGGLAFSSAGILYFATANGPKGLYTLNTTTGAVTSVIPLASSYDGLAVRPSDGLLFGTFASGGEGIGTITPTGTETLVGGTQQLADLAFSPSGGGPVATPEPGTAALFGLGGFALAGAVAARRRRRPTK